MAKQSKSGPKGGEEESLCQDLAQRHTTLCVKLSPGLAPSVNHGATAAAIKPATANAHWRSPSWSCPTITFTR